MVGWWINIIARFIFYNTKTRFFTTSSLIFYEKCQQYRFYIRGSPRFFDQVGHETMYASSGNKHFFTKSCHRQTYQNYEQPPWTSQNSYFQSHFSVLKIGWIFPKKKFYEEYLTRRPTFIKKCFWKFWFLRYFIF